MRLNLSSQIVLNKVPEAFYRPLTAVDRSEITRLEKLPTEIYPKMEEAAEAVAYDIIDEIKQKQREGKYCVLGLGTGTSLTPVYDELIRRHKKEGVSFQNVIVFNAYEYFPITPETQASLVRTASYYRWLAGLMEPWHRSACSSIAASTSSASRPSVASTSCFSASDAWETSPPTNLARRSTRSRASS